MTLNEIKTEDGSSTFFNEEVGDIYHCRSGAVREAIEKYAIPCRIAELARAGEVRILDSCFGLGYNTAAALDAALASSPSCEIFVEALEIDREIIGKIAQVQPSFQNFSLIKELAKSPNYEYINGNIHLRVILGDARETILKTSGGFDAVFFDPFSPKKQPELWQQDFFRDIRFKMKKGGILATYSYARSVRDNLALAGFIVSDGPIVGRRSPSTLAVNPL
jgi:tRNA U34 5-methylaminomethyl-2-thiouridine-forming methyltransferase MnmC